MKKNIYIAPKTTVNEIELQNGILITSNVKLDGESTLTSSDYILSHEDNGWDIWSDD